ncbi:tenascin-R [Elysia marginata]|uniref:Tenascin-R n=1 Tax=Elysia marginata TaxID=1093978 RepID=A0AAV4GR11_9GAST|nr:tenascin-R [Elysia marginata]
MKFDNMIKANERMANSTEDLDARLQKDFAILNQNFEQLKLVMENRTIEMISTVRNAIADSNATMRNSLAACNIYPTKCEKGMVPYLNDDDGQHLTIHPDGKSPPGVPYLCDTRTDGGGWIVIQRRVSGATGFYRGWADYKNGFGSLQEEYWLGNDHIHAPTSRGAYELRIDLEYNGQIIFAHYSSFSIGGEDSNYALRLGKYDGTAGDSLGPHNGYPFSTYDKDNDNVPSVNRAKYFQERGGIIKSNYSNLNGKWNSKANSNAALWWTLSSSDSVSFSEIKIRKL